MVVHASRLPFVNDRAQIWLLRQPALSPKTRDLVYLSDALDILDFGSNVGEATQFRIDTRCLGLKRDCCILNKGINMPFDNKSLDFPLSNACPTPSKQVLGCLSEWTCRHVINLDLRCLLNINSHPLLGNLLDTNGITGGLLDGLLGR
uniref:Uncharacterized protein n=1 Tax=Glossina austeni TaxID=7395 RepID=A0A1A9VHL3_GLOAU